MSKKCTVLILTTFFINCCFSQYEAHRWYFTETSNKGILFNYGTNVPGLITEHINPYALEGSGIANNPNDGSLMFYSTGDKILDKNHQPMPNGSGLTSHFSSAQKGIVCPKPGNCNQYYVFHNNSAVEVAIGSYYYSLVDLSLPGNGTIPVPLGDVVPGQKNVFLKGNVGESSVVISSTQTNKYWLVISTFDANEMAVFRIDSSGITPAGSYDVPYTITDFRNLKFSYEAGKIALISGRENEATILMDFNRTTGVISGVMNIPGTPVGSDPTYYNGMYDGEWSSDGTKFYIGKWRVPSGISGGRIYQYNLNTPAVNASIIYTVTGNTTNILAGLRRGPDGKIYFGYNHQTFGYRYLGVINSPNLAGAACNPVSLGFDLGSDVGLWGKFPDFLPPNKKPIAQNDTITMGCPDTAINSFQVLMNDSDLDDDQFNLNFFNIPSYVNITINPNQTINVDLDSVIIGTLSIPYQLCDLKCFSKCDTAYLIIEMLNETEPMDFLLSDTVICDNNSVILSSSISGSSYLWNTSETTSTISVNSAGVYELTIAVNACLYHDSTIVFEEYPPAIDLGPDTLICDGSYIILTATYPSSSYLWNNGSVTSQIPVTTDGIYSVEVSNLCGTFTDSIGITFNNAPLLDLGPDTALCEGDSISLTAFWPGSTILWSTGSNAPVIHINSAGIYWASITNECGTVTDSISVTIIKGCSGLEDLNSIVTLYPNPASEYVYISTPNKTTHLLNASMISIDGKSLMIENISQSSQGYYFNLGEIAPGIYVLALNFEEGKVNRKLIVTR